MDTGLVWKPHPKQEEFLSLPDSIFEGLYGGAAGGGKSECLILFPITRGFYKHPRFKGIIFRRTFPELESEIIVRSKLWYPATGAKYNEEKKRWTFPSGAIMQFGHVEYDKDVQNYDTAEYNYMAFDELTSFTMHQYKYLAYSRCRSSSRDLPAIVRAGTNPGNIGHAWVRKHFVEPAPHGHKIVLDRASGLKRIFIQAKANDNPHIDPTYINRLMMLPEADRRAKLDGDWWTFEGQVFDDWRESRIPDEPANALHVIEPFIVPPYWPRILAIDWGFSAMLCALWGAISPDDRLFVYREYTAVRTKISVWAKEIGQISRHEEIRRVVLCQSAWQNRGDEENIAEQFQRYSGFKPQPAENARIAGKLTLQEFLRWKPRAPRPITGDYSHQTAQRILRNLGEQAYQEYCDSFKEEEPEKNLPRIQVFNTCPAVISTIPLCVYDKTDNVSGKPAEDVKEFDGDDPYDTVRYLVMEADKISTQELKQEHSHRTEVAEVIETFEKTGDWTRFHRQMEFVERRDPKIRAVRRMHRGRR